jgi:hypothetical protein
MKTKIITLSSLFVSCQLATAATVVTPYENPGSDGVAFPYEAKTTFAVTDAWSTSTSVGGWSYVDLDPAKNQNRGWGHTSSWFLLEITGTSWLEITLGSTDATTRPGFVLYAGESVEDNPAAAHTYSNNGLQVATLNAAWDKNGPGGTPGLTYVTHAFNPSGASVTAAVQLNPGLYTLAVGNGADSRTNPGGRTLDLALTTVPEPSSALLGALAALTLLRRRR